MNTAKTINANILVAVAALLMTSCQRGGGGLGNDDKGSSTDGDDDGSPLDTTAGDDAITLLCQPDEVQCSDQDTLQRCAPTGQEWLSEDCPVNYSCVDCDGESCAVDHCAGPCEADALVPSSAGCSFVANRQLHLFEDEGDAVIVANPNEELTATVKFWRTPEGKRKEELVEEVEVVPGGDAIFLMTQEFVLGDSTMFRTGGTFRVESDVPVIAYQHAPAENNAGNESSMLLPESALGQDYVIAAYNPHPEQNSGLGMPTYFEIVALEDDTTVEWTPPVPTAGNGLPVDAVLADTTGSQTMNRFDTLRVAASASYEDEFPPIMQDVSGTVIHADKPIWVVAGSRCSRIPIREEPADGFCDPLQEVMIPVKYWGDHYVAPHPPIRHTERHFWRIYSGSDNVAISLSEPVLDEVNCSSPNTFVNGTCVLERRGSWIEFSVENGTSLVIEGDGPFMPVGYLQSRTIAGEPPEWSTTWGDPAMYQLAPTAQFLDRYVIRTAVGFPHHYVQVTRAIGGANIVIDGGSVVQPSEWEQVGDFEVATHELEEGPHVLHSADPFGVVQIGLTEDGHYSGCRYISYESYLEVCPTYGDQEACNAVNQCVWEEGACTVKRICRSSYAHPGGMKSEPIFIP